MRWQDELAVRLAPVGSDFGQELVGSDACGRSQPRFGQNFRPDFFRHVAGIGNLLQIVGNVQIGFVQRKRFDKRGVAAENTVNLRRNTAVEVEMRRHINRLRAEPFRGRHRHRRMQAELPRFVGRGADYRTRTFPCYDHGFAFEVRLFAQLDRGVESVHIDMDDFALSHGFGVGMATGREGCGNRRFYIGEAV